LEKYYGVMGWKCGMFTFEISKVSIYYYKFDFSFLFKLKDYTFSVQCIPIDLFTIFGKLKDLHDSLKINEYHL
jgi:hypothetical protein